MTPTDRSPSPDTAQAWHAQPLAETLDRLATDRTRGLSMAESDRRRERYGRNEIIETGGRAAWQIMLDQFTNIMLIMLIAVALISGVLDVVELRSGVETEGIPFKDTIAILIIVILNGILGYLQESRAEKALAALKELSAPQVRVLRDGQIREIESPELVPGDLLLVEAGSKIAADGRLLSAANLQVRESALTGESEAVLKQPDTVLDEDAPLGDRFNSVFAGTEVVQGHAQVVVTATGMQTELGKIAQMIQEVESEPTPLQRRMDGLAQVLVSGSLILVALVVVGGVLLSGFGRLQELVEVSLSMAVAVVPEGLPAVITVTLAIGTQRMVRRQALIRKLPAVETLGSVNAICSDKTGTLTQNKMVVQKVALPAMALNVSGEGYVPQGEFTKSSPLSEFKSEGTSPGEAIAPRDYPALHALLMGAVLCNDATLSYEDEVGNANISADRSDREWRVIGDPTEGALLALAGKAGLERAELSARIERVEDYPFSSERKRMSVVCRFRESEGGQLLMFTKGSPEIVLERCQFYQQGDETLPLTESDRTLIRRQNEQMAGRGLRVLGFALKTLDEAPPLNAEDTAERDLTWLGLTGMLDAPRPEVKTAVATCRQAGIRTLMITGDHQLTARAIAEFLGIAEPEEKVLTGQELEKLSGLDLETAVEETNVYARVAPEHKLRIVQALQKRDRFVAMTGDGVNDAPALKQADIGIAMGITGTDVSKEASDMVLLDDNFATIVAATEEGRVVYANIRRFIKYILGSNVGEVLTVAAAPILGLPGVPLTPLQILWMNLVTDGLPALALAVEPADSDVMKHPPYSPKESIFARGLGNYIVRIGIVFAIFTIALMWWAYGETQGTANPDSWKTMVFTTLCVAQMGHAIAARSQKPTLEVNFFSNPYLLAAVAVTTILQLLLVYVPPLRAFFGTTVLSLPQLLICLGFSTLIFVWVELEKFFIRWYRNRG